MERLSKKSTSASMLLAVATILFGFTPINLYADSKGKELVNELVEQARKEGQLNTAIITQMGPAVPRLKAAFNKRFGLNLKIKVALGDQAGKFARLLITMRAGGRPPFDTLPGTDDDNFSVISYGFAEKIKNWKLLLAEANPVVRSGKVKPVEVSPRPFTGYSYTFSTRGNGLIYNTKLINKDNVPKTYADLANPKFKGMFPVPPWMSQWYMGILVYDKDEWLKIAEKTGRNATGVLRFNPAINRMLLGEFSFMAMNSHYLWEIKSKDAQAPLSLRFFSDYIPFTRVMYIVPKRARHPAAAKLWALWITSPEAEAIWQSVTKQENLAFGQSEVDRKARKLIKDSNAKLVTWFDSAESIKKLRWITSAEGTRYKTKIRRAITQRK